MRNNKLLSEIDLWEAWIEFDHEGTENFGTLYILGEVPVSKTSQHPFFKKCIQENDPQTLVLSVELSDSVSASGEEEVVFSEKLPGLDKYNSIKIYRGKDLIKEITEIEVLI
ncbi:MAG TPA: hypothetical protein VJ499_02300 [Flavisolibacter sp.]|nr:hypothetical protein [Flavisolibacter sp.]